MPDVREFKVVFEAAEAAATAGEFPRAEQLLREGLRLQEAALGPAHPHIASTMNNLAVVCETLGQLDDAERFYRRATAVASAALPADDPLVTTSLANLRDFCAANQRTLDPLHDFSPGPGPARPAAPAARPATAPPRPVAATAAVSASGATTAPRGTAAIRPSAATTAPRGDSRPPAPPRPASVPASAPAASTPRSLLAIVAIVALVAVLGWTWIGRRNATDPAPDGDLQTTAATPPADAPAAPAPSPSASAPPPSAATTPATVSPSTTTTPAPLPAPVAPPAARAAASAESPRGAPDAAAAGDVRVVTAQVCASLDRAGGAWRCSALEASPAPGRYYFYTRIASPRGARIRHRWSIDGRVRQDVALSVGASATQGYRTFSRQTMSRGRWTVELVGAGGDVLHQATFDVQ